MLRTSDETEEIMPAFLAAQQELDPVHKDAANPHFRSRYATLEACLAASLPHLHRHGLVLTHAIGEIGERVWVETRVTHAASGQWVAANVPFLPPKDDPQGAGSALTYARRYGVMALLCIAPEDDDGDAASRPGQEREGRGRPLQQSARTPRPAPQPASRPSSPDGLALRQNHVIDLLRAGKESAQTEAQQRGGDPHAAKERFEGWVNDVAGVALIGPRGLVRSALTAEVCNALERELAPRLAGRGAAA